MKTLTQLNQEIKKLEKVVREVMDAGGEVVIEDVRRLQELKALSTQLKEVIEMIEKLDEKNKVWINMDGDMYVAGKDNPNKTEDGGISNDTWEKVIFTKELITQLQGENKDGN